MSQAMSPMDKIGNLPDGRALFYADEHFEEPGFYVTDPSGADGAHQRVELIPARGTPAGEASTAVKLAADHMAEAALHHAHGVEFQRDAERLRDDEKMVTARAADERAVLHFELARSAAAVAHAASGLQIASELDTGLHNLAHAVGVASGT